MWFGNFAAWLLQWQVQDSLPGNILQYDNLHVLWHTVVYCDILCCGILCYTAVHCDILCYSVVHCDTLVYCGIYCVYYDTLVYCGMLYTVIPYSGKLLREKTFMNWWKIQFSQIACSCRAKDTTPPNSAELTCTNSHKTAKFAKVFSFESFLLYGTLVCCDTVWYTVVCCDILWYTGQ